MSTKQRSLIPLRLVEKVKAEKSNAPADIVTDGLFRKFGGVTCAIHPIDGCIKYVLVGSVDVNNPKTLSPKKIDKQVAMRLDKLNSVSTLFTLEIWSDVAFIRYFTDIASLQDILGVRDSWQIKARHVHVLVADVGAPPHSAIIALTVSDTQWHICATQRQFAEKQFFDW
ncbi:hypothetical protein Alg130_11239 [Pyrenophora tritici-repentis]|nr:hypothetical protein Alg130_11239 [Pyrenophora tritici-repentis]